MIDREMLGSGREKVIPWTVPYYLELRVVMGDAARVLLGFTYDRPLDDFQRARVRSAAKLLQPTDEGEGHSGSDVRRIIDAQQALDLPPDDLSITRAVLGRSAAILEALSCDESVTLYEAGFASGVVMGMRRYAAEQRTIPTDVVWPRV